MLKCGGVLTVQIIGSVDQFDIIAVGTLRSYVRFDSDQLPTESMQRDFPGHDLSDGLAFR